MATKGTLIVILSCSILVGCSASSNELCGIAAEHVTACTGALLADVPTEACDVATAEATLARDCDELRGQLDQAKADEEKTSLFWCLLGYKNYCELDWKISLHAIDEDSGKPLGGLDFISIGITNGNGDASVSLHYTADHWEVSLRARPAGFWSDSGVADCGELTRPHRRVAATAATIKVRMREQTPAACYLQ